MRETRRRSTWTSPVAVHNGGRHAGPLVRRPRRRLLPWTVGGGLVAGALVAGALVGLDTPPALAVCASRDTGCVDPVRTSGSFVAILPLEQPGDAALTVSNSGSTARAEVGVLGYLTEDRPSEQSVVRSGTASDSRLTVARGERRAVALRGAPANARAVVVRLGGTPAAEKSGGSAVVTFSNRVQGVSKSDVAEALQQWSARTAGAQVDQATITRIAAQVAAELPVAAHLTVEIEAQSTTLRVGWSLDPGTEDVTAVRVVRIGKAADGTKTAQVDVPVDESGTVLSELRESTAYTVSVSPVIDGASGASVVLAATTGALDDGVPASDGPKKAEQSAPPVQPSTAAPSSVPSSVPVPSTASPSALAPAVGGGSSSIPAPPAGWEPVYEQTFDKDAPVGGFGAAYPGYSGYDGGIDTSRTAGRASDRTGLWTNVTTSSVHDGLYDCRLHTIGVRPQVCALTPTPNGKYWGGQTYGRYTVRFKTDPTPGYKIAWLLWPETNRWADGEIDFPEGSLDGTITGSVHDTTGNPSRNAYWVDTKKRMNTWQTATIEWTPGRVSFVLDGQVWTTTERSGMPRGPMRWALQAETEIQAAAPDPSVQGRIYIDWLAGYRYTGT